MGSKGQSSKIILFAHGSQGKWRKDHRNRWRALARNSYGVVCQIVLVKLKYVILDPIWLEQNGHFHDESTSAPPYSRNQREIICWQITKLPQLVLTYLPVVIAEVDRQYLCL